MPPSLRFQGRPGRFSRIRAFFPTGIGKDNLYRMAGPNFLYSLDDQTISGFETSSNKPPRVLRPEVHFYRSPLNQIPEKGWNLGGVQEFLLVVSP